MTFADSGEERHKPARLLLGVNDFAWLAPESGALAPSPRPDWSHGIATGIQTAADSGTAMVNDTMRGMLAVCGLC